MRNNTFAITVGFLLAGITGGLLMFFPDRASAIAEGMRHMVDKRPEIVRLEYLAGGNENVRGWQTLRVVTTADLCLPLMERDFSQDKLVVGQIIGLRCSGYRNNGTPMGIIKTQWVTPQTADARGGPVHQ